MFGAAYELIYVEPAWRYLGPFRGTAPLIAYRSRDVTTDIWQYLHNDALFANRTDDPIAPLAREGEDNKPRVRRQTKYEPASNKTFCPMYLVADYLFCKHIGDGSESRTAEYMLEVIDRVNKYFWDTVFDAGLPKFGLHDQRARGALQPTTSTSSIGRRATANGAKRLY